MGIKIIDIKMRCDALWGRKSKAGGKKIKSDSMIYTPGIMAFECITILSPYLKSNS